jgi:hypothetical protein
MRWSQGMWYSAIMNVIFSFIQTTTAQLFFAGYW